MAPHSISSPPLALTMGDPGGVGPEVTAKAWRALRESGPAFFLIGAPELIEQSDASAVIIDDPRDAVAAFSEGAPVLPIHTPIDAKSGVSSPVNAAAVIESIERAVAFAVAGAAAGVVTNPINKSSLLAAGFGFPGHTEFLGALTKDAAMPQGRRRGPAMMLAGPALRTIPVTVHLSVKQAIAALTPKRIVDAALIAAEALHFDFGVETPRLAISGLNPHAGEGGALGAEDQLIIAPAVDELRAAGLDARGPLSADALFHQEARLSYDAALCMLHDQALIPVKTLDFYDAVNVTLGLPIIRTSPDHGVALDIAGKGTARADSLIAAIRLAADIAARRRTGP